MAHNGLAVNPAKSEAIVFSTRQRLVKLKALGFSKLSILGAAITISDSMTVLGVTLDSTLSFQNHCSNMVRSCMYHIRAIRHIRPYITLDDAKLLSSAFIQSRLDYCNALLLNVPSTSLKRLQRVQNATARITVQKPLEYSFHSYPARSLQAPCCT